MFSSVIASVIAWVINLVSTFGYLGVFIAMAIEAASIPLPSEIIMGIAGYLVYKGELNLFLVGLIGALGNATGSTIMYVLGSKGGRPFIDKYGKYIHLNQEKFVKVEKWFDRWGDKTIFVFQLLPIVRTFVSLPLGILKVNFVKFRIYTFTGALIWCTLLSYVSSLLGPQWEKISDYIKQFEWILLALFLAGLVFYLGSMLYKRKLFLSKVK